jgi:hypothetical protein
MTGINFYPSYFISKLRQQVSIAPLALFRILFGLMMFIATLRFMLNGWVDELYIKPQFFFTYYRFEWIKPIGATGMYVVFTLIAISALLVCLGLFYRVAIITFFVLFTYTELIDKSIYLNHYYLVALVSGLMCLLPAHRFASLDVKFGLTKPMREVPYAVLFVIQLQLVMVYFFAGIAKINYDWLINAMPLKVWLPAKSDMPLIGGILSNEITAYIFSWCGMLFDVCIAFFLFSRRTVWYAYAVILIFHIVTAILFPGIGMFPFVMMVITTVFLPETFHKRVLSFINSNPTNTLVYKPAGLLPAFLGVYFLVQALMPFRYLLYPGKLFYTEQGYRFSWRVMLMEKTGFCTFYTEDDKGKREEINPAYYLTPLQQRQMNTQPDMILQFARYLSAKTGNSKVYAESYVSLNGRGSVALIDPNTDLASEVYDLNNRKWIVAR